MGLALVGLVVGLVPVNFQLFPWQLQCLKKEATEESRQGLGHLSWRPQGHSARRDSLWPGNPFCHGSLPPPPPTLGSSLSALRRGPGPFSFTSLSSPSNSPAPPLGPRLTSPRARGAPRSQRRQASRTAISAPLQQRQQQLWWHERLKTRTTAWAKLRAGKAEPRRGGAVCNQEGVLRVDQ